VAKLFRQRQAGRAFDQSVLKELEDQGRLRLAKDLLSVADALHATLGRGDAVAGRSWLVLVAWAIATPVAAALTFRWE